MIAEAKAATAKAKEQQNTHHTHTNARRAVPLPRVLINLHTQPAVPPFQGCRPLPQWMIVEWWVVVVKDRLYILQCRLLDPDCRLLGIRPCARGNTGPPARGPIIHPRMKMESTVTGTTPGPG